ncbi:MAG: hypothetical protein WCW52_03220 [Elusimicrobiales bacterium]|jgi:hypothetical protein
MVKILIAAAALASAGPAAAHTHEGALAGLERQVPASNQRIPVPAGAGKISARAEKLALARKMAIDWVEASIRFLSSPESAQAAALINDPEQLRADYQKIAARLKSENLSFDYPYDGEPDRGFCEGTHYEMYTTNTNRNIINACNSAFQLRTAVIAQKLVHEMTHNLSRIDECAATQAEMLAPVLGDRRMPAGNGYTDTEGECQEIGNNIGRIYLALEGGPAEIKPPAVGGSFTISPALWKKLLDKKFLTVPGKDEPAGTQLLCHLDIYNIDPGYSRDASRPKTFVITETPQAASGFYSISQEPGLTVALNCSLPTGMPLTQKDLSEVFQGQLTLK